MKIWNWLRSTTTKPESPPSIKTRLNNSGINTQNLIPSLERLLCSVQQGRFDRLFLMRTSTPMVIGDALILSQLRPDGLHPRKTYTIVGGTSQTFLVIENL